MLAQIEAFFPIIWFAFIWLVFFHTAYRIWFKTSEYQDSIIKSYERLPKWFPLRDLNISWYGSPVGIWLLKVFTLLITLVFFAGLVFTLWGLLFMR